MVWLNRLASQPTRNLHELLVEKYLAAMRGNKKELPMFYRLSGFAIMATLYAVAPAIAQTSANTNNSPVGVWTNGDREVVVRISSCASGAATFCGTILEDNRPGPAANPPNHVLLRDLRADRQGWRGKVNDGGMQLNLTMRITTPTSAQARYCFAMACETETWTRTSESGNVGQQLRR